MWMHTITNANIVARMAEVDRKDDFRILLIESCRIVIASAARNDGIGERGMSIP